MSPRGAGIVISLAFPFRLRRFQRSSPARRVPGLSHSRLTAKRESWAGRVTAVQQRRRFARSWRRIVSPAVDDRGAWAFIGGWASQRVCAGCRSMGEYSGRRHEVAGPRHCRRCDACALRRRLCRACRRRSDDAYDLRFRLLHTNLNGAPPTTTRRNLEWDDSKGRWGLNFGVEQHSTDRDLQAWPTSPPASTTSSLARLHIGGAVTSSPPTRSKPCAWASRRRPPRASASRRSSSSSQGFFLHPSSRGEGRSSGGCSHAGISRCACSTRQTSTASAPST